METEQLPAKIIQKPRGSNLLYRGYCYRKDRGYGEKQHWRCINHTGCFARVHTVGEGENVQVLMYKEHTHPPDDMDKENAPPHTKESALCDTAPKKVKFSTEEMQNNHEFLTDATIFGSNKSSEMIDKSTNTRDDAEHNMVIKSVSGENNLVDENGETNSKLINNNEPQVRNQEEPRDLLEQLQFLIMVQQGLQPENCYTDTKEPQIDIKDKLTANMADNNTFQDLGQKVPFQHDHNNNAENNIGLFDSKIYCKDNSAEETKVIEVIDLTEDGDNCVNYNDIIDLTEEGDNKENCVNYDDISTDGYSSDDENYQDITLKQEQDPQSNSEHNQYKEKEEIPVLVVDDYISTDEYSSSDDESHHQVTEIPLYKTGDCISTDEYSSDDDESCHQVTESGLQSHYTQGITKDQKNITGTTETSTNTKVSLVNIMEPTRIKRETSENEVETLENKSKILEISEDCKNNSFGNEGGSEFKNITLQNENRSPEKSQNQSKILKTKFENEENGYETSGDLSQKLKQRRFAVSLPLLFVRIKREPVLDRHAIRNYSKKPKITDIENKENQNREKANRPKTVEASKNNDKKPTCLKEQQENNPKPLHFTEELKTPNMKFEQKSPGQILESPGGKSSNEQTAPPSWMLIKPDKPSSEHLYKHNHPYFYCTLCTFKTGVRGCIIHHIRTHTGEKPYVCSICNKAFAQSGVLKRHYISIHTDQRDFQCSYCPKKFAQKGACVTHERTHTKEKPFPCHLCSKSFSCTGIRTAHIRTHTGEKPYVCTYCEKSFAQLIVLKRHLRSHTGEKPFSCAVCNKRFTEKASAREHMSIHTGEKPFTCHICNKSFRLKESLQYHLKTHTDEKNYPCKYCNKRFRKKGALDIHIRRHTGEKPYKCTYCNYASCDDGTLKRHLVVHTKIRAYKCPECDKTYCRKSVLNVHISSVHRGAKDYACSVCDKRFSTNASLFSHKMVHKTERKYACEICGHRFKNNHALKNHKKRHYDFKPFKCSYCRKRFYERFSQRMHERTHTGYKPFKCAFCGSSWASSGALITHLRVHTGEKPYKCEICKTGFAQAIVLKRHLKGLHKIDRKRIHINRSN